MNLFTKQTDPQTWKTNYGIEGEGGSSLVMQQV